jgi:hypothetical protein
LWLEGTKISWARVHGLEKHLWQRKSDTGATAQIHIGLCMYAHELNTKEQKQGGEPSWCGQNTGGSKWELPVRLLPHDEIQRKGEKGGVSLGSCCVLYKSIRVWVRGGQHATASAHLGAHASAGLGPSSVFQGNRTQYIYPYGSTSGARPERERPPPQQPSSTSTPVLPASPKLHCR